MEFWMVPLKRAIHWRLGRVLYSVFGVLSHFKCHIITCRVYNSGSKTLSKHVKTLPVPIHSTQNRFRYWRIYPTMSIPLKNNNNNNTVWRSGQVHHFLKQLVQILSFKGLGPIFHDQTLQFNRRWVTQLHHFKDILIDQLAPSCRHLLGRWLRSCFHLPFQKWPRKRSGNRPGHKYHGLYGNFRTWAVKHQQTNCWLWHLLHTFLFCQPISKV